MNTLRPPPHYVIVPAEMIYGDNRLPDELHRSYEVILGLAWVRHYERTPPVSVAELAQLRGIGQRTMALHIAKLKERGFLEALPGREGKRPIYRLLVRDPARLPFERPVTTAVRHPVHVHETSDGPEEQEVVKKKPLQPTAGGTPHPCNRSQGVGNNVVVDDPTEHREQQQSFYSLLHIGVLEDIALELARSHDPSRVMDWVEYASRAQGVRNPAGMVVAGLRRGIDPPQRVRSRQRYISGPYAPFIRH